MFCIIQQTYEKQKNLSSFNGTLNRHQVRLPSGRLSMLQRTHLSDFPEFFGALSSSLQTGDKISVVVVNTEMVSLDVEMEWTGKQRKI